LFITLPFKAFIVPLFTVIEPVPLFFIAVLLVDDMFPPFIVIVPLELLYTATLLTDVIVGLPDISILPPELLNIAFDVGEVILPPETITFPHLKYYI